MGEILPKFGIFRATYTFLVQILYKKCSDPKKKTVTGHLKAVAKQCYAPYTWVSTSLCGRQITLKKGYHNWSYRQVQPFLAQLRCLFFFKNFEKRVQAQRSLGLCGSNHALGKF